MRVMYIALPVLIYGVHRMQREEKQLEAALESIILRVQDIKNAIAAFLAKLETEHETLKWPSVLDNFALLSGQISSLNNLLKNEKVPQLRQYITLPLVLSHEADRDLEKVTEGRVVTFNPDSVPHYLRTKPEMEIEEKLNQFNTKASQLSADNVQKQIATLNRITGSVADNLKKFRDDWESETGQRRSQPSTSSSADTQALIAALNTGKTFKQGLKRQDAISNPPPDMPRPQQSRPNIPTPQIITNKAPMFRTNIKTASHPYTRP